MSEPAKFSDQKGLMESVGISRNAPAGAGTKAGAGRSGGRTPGHGHADESDAERAKSRAAAGAMDKAQKIKLGLAVGMIGAVGVWLAIWSGLLNFGPNATPTEPNTPEAVLDPELLEEAKQIQQEQIEEAEEDPDITTGAG